MRKSDFSTEELPLLKWLEQWLENRSLTQALEQVETECLRIFPGAPLRWARLAQDFVREELYASRPVLSTEASAEEMICRCHEVTRGQIMQWFEQNPQGSRMNLTKALLCGSGCGSCVLELEQIAHRHRAPARRWHGETAAEWIVRLQASLMLWLPHAPEWVEKKQLEVSAFREGAVHVRVQGGLTADQEWELSRLLTSYWAEGMPAPLSVFLDFALL